MAVSFDNPSAVKGLGTDATRISRFRSMSDPVRERMARKILSEDEMAVYRAAKDPCVSLARSFCQKECVSKCLGTGYSNGVHFSDIIIKRDPLGRPTVWLQKGAQKRAEELGMKSIMISLTDEGDTVICVCIGM